MQLNYRFLTKLFINPANWFLVFLVTAVMVNCYLSFQQKAKETQLVDSKIIVRPLSQQKSDFGELKYNVLYENGLWQLDTPKALRIGQLVQIQGQLRPYKLESTSEDQFANYALSLGISGDIKVKQIIATDTICDLTCNLIKQLNNTQYYVSRTYQTSFCGLSQISKFLTLENDCQNVFGLSVGLVLGGSGEFDKTMKQNFRTLGLSHLVAVSGFQVILVASLVESWLKHSRLNKKLQLIGIIIFLFLLIGLVGPQPPVLRSSLSLIISLFFLTFFGRQLSLTRSLIYSALVMLIINPFYLISISFLLSFAASFGLSILPSGMNNERLTQAKPEGQGFWAGLWQTLRELSISTLVAFGFTLPIILGLNPQNSLIGILLNILIIPTIPILTALNILGLIPFIGEFLLVIVNLAQSLLLLLVQEVTRIAPSFLIGTFQIWEMVLYYILIILVCFWTRLWTNKNKI